MPPTSPPNVERALALLVRTGLLLEADAELPSVATLAAGAPVRGSWWAHPAGHAIFALCTALQAHPDILCLKLVRAKRTYVHRRLWPALIAVASAREPWQVRGISADARALLARVEREGALHLDEFAPPGTPHARNTAATARSLEERCLVYAASRHTEKGAHARVLRSWSTFARDARLRTPGLEPARGRADIEAAVAALRGSPPTARDLPWLRPVRA